MIPQKYAMSMMMFQMASGGKNTITLPQITNMAAMPLQMAMMQSGSLLEGLLSAGPLASAPPAIKELIKEYDAKFKNNLRDNLDTLLKPLFSIIDGMCFIYFFIKHTHTHIHKINHLR